MKATFFVKMRMQIVTEMIYIYIYIYTHTCIYILFRTMTFSQSLNILSSNCVISVDRNCVLLLLLFFFLPTLIDKDKILLCCVMSCQTSPSSTRTTLQQKKPLPKSIITINMCALQNHTVRHERHRSSINNVSSLHLVLMLQS